MARRFVLTLAVAALVAAPVASADPLGKTTLEERVVPGPAGDGFTFLQTGPGDPYVTREELVAAKAQRDERRRSLAYFAQLSDFQLADEESPARVEVLDQTYSGFSSAWRPWEALIPHTVDASVRQINTHGTSPVAGAGGKRAKLAFAVTTGDNADSQQRNESQWVARLLEGGRLDPNSGSADPAAYAACPGLDAQLAAEAPLYTGVQDYDDYVESGTYWDPDRPEASTQWAKWPKYPGLMDRAQQAFDTPGLDVPSYVALGNHDGLVQGNEDAIAPYELIAIGCVKPFSPAPSLTDPAGAFATSLLSTTPQNTVLVPPDPARDYVTKPEYRAIFAGGEQSDAHGFSFVDADELAASAGAASYYDFSPVPGLRIVTLDTVANGGIAGITDKGNVDDPQFRWLGRVLDEAEAADELVIVTSHHAPVSMTADVPDEIAGPCEDPAHPERNLNAGCDLDPRDSAPIHLGADLTALLLEHPHVVAWVAGHSHVNDVEPVKAPSGASGFWIVRTSAEADYPHQDRLIELMDNRDGTLSLFGTLLDNASPAVAPPSGTDASGLSTDQLASIARTLGFNDPQGDPNAPGEVADRNVELVVPDPRRDRGTPPAFVADVRGERLSVRVRPRRLRVGRTARVRITVRRNGRPLRHAKVRLGSRRAVTNRRGRAVIRVKPRRTGLLKVRLRGRTIATILVVRR